MSVSPCPYCAGIGIAYLPDIPCRQCGGSGVLADIDSRLKKLLIHGRVIDAVKLYRGERGVGLREAIDYVNDLRYGRPASAGEPRHD